VFELMNATPTENEERRASRAAIELSLLLAEGDAEGALAIGEAFVRDAIEKVGIDHESVRQAWPETVHAALAVGAAGPAQRVLALVSQRPPGMIPPFLSAHLARAAGLIRGLDDRDETVERDLRAAVDLFTGLGYAYWAAVAQIDLAGWLERRGEVSQAAPLRDDATAALIALGAPPAGTRPPVSRSASASSI
jgi:hypothetical protein